MPYQSRFGKQILSAGEISTYTICPKAWELMYLKKKKTIIEEPVKKGEELHQEWSENLKQTIYLTWGTRLVFLLIVLLVLLLLLFLSLA